MRLVRYEWLPNSEVRQLIRHVFGCGRVLWCQITSRT
ncbi:helix-turn-helix domain-containing protein [Sphingomonas sp. PAMC 26621]